MVSSSTSGPAIPPGSSGESTPISDRLDISVDPGRLPSKVEVIEEKGVAIFLLKGEMKNDRTGQVHKFTARVSKEAWAAKAGISKGSIDDPGNIEKLTKYFEKTVTAIKTKIETDRTGRLVDTLAGKHIRVGQDSTEEAKVKFMDGTGRYVDPSEGTEKQVAQIIGDTYTEQMKTIMDLFKDAHSSEYAELVGGGSSVTTVATPESRTSGSVAPRSPAGGDDYDSVTTSAANTGASTPRKVGVEERGDDDDDDYRELPTAASSPGSRVESVGGSVPASGVTSPGDEDEVDSGVLTTSETPDAGGYGPLDHPEAATDSSVAGGAPVVPSSPEGTTFHGVLSDLESFQSRTATVLDVGLVDAGVTDDAQGKDSGPLQKMKREAKSAKKAAGAFFSDLWGWMKGGRTHREEINASAVELPGDKDYDKIAVDPGSGKDQHYQPLGQGETYLPKTTGDYTHVGDFVTQAGGEGLQAGVRTRGRQLQRRSLSERKITPISIPEGEILEMREVKAGHFGVVSQANRVHGVAQRVFKHIQDVDVKELETLCDQFGFSDLKAQLNGTVSPENMPQLRALKVLYKMKQEDSGLARKEIAEALVGLHTELTTTSAGLTSSSLVLQEQDKGEARRLFSEIMSDSAGGQLEDQLQKIMVQTETQDAGQSKAFVDLLLLIDRAHLENIALKQLKQKTDASTEANQKAAKEFHDEAVLNDQLPDDHPNIAKMRLVEMDRQLYLMGKFAEYGSLEDFLSNGFKIKGREPLSEQEVVGLIEGMAKGLQACAERRIVHRDFAPRNVLIDADNEGGICAKVTDFGMSRITEGDSAVVPNVAGEERPLQSVAPEELRREGSTEKSDVWSFGVMLRQMLLQESSPYEKRGYGNNIFLPVEVRDGRVSPVLTEDEERKAEKNTNIFQGQTARQLIGLIGLCCDFDPKNRPSFEEITQFLQGVKGAASDEHIGGPSDVGSGPVAGTGGYQAPPPIPDE